MRKFVRGFIPFMMVLCMVAGCGSEENTGDFDNGMEMQATEKEIHVTETIEKQIVAQDYPELIEQVKAGLADGFQTVTTEELGISFVFNYGTETLGYCLMDLDNDGIEELLFGEDGEGAWANTIYDIYTMRDGKLVHVVAGGERNRFYLTDKGAAVLANEASSGAASSYYVYYNYTNEGLEVIEAVIYDGWKDEKHPWFYSTESTSSENASTISEDVAREIIGNYKYENIDFVLFVNE